MWGDTMTLTIIILLAWLPLSALLALLVGACIRFGSASRTRDPLQGTPGAILRKFSASRRPLRATYEKG